MAFRRRTTFPGIDPRANKELIGLQDDLLSEQQKLREQAIGSTSDTKQSGTYAVKFYERVRVSPAAAGVDLIFPAAIPTTQNAWIEVLVLKAGNVRLRPTGGNIQNAALLTLTAVGFFYFQSDGVSGWWMQPASTGGLSPPVALTDLAAIADQTWLGNVSGGVATPSALNQTQMKTYIGVFGAATTGLVPASGGGTTNFLRADGTFAAPGGGGVPDGYVKLVAAMRG